MSFLTDPLSFLESSLETGRDVFWLPDRQLCVAEPNIARAVLRNADGRYRPHSDFFDTIGGTFGPREAQIALANGARMLLEARIAEADIPACVSAIGAESVWPRAGVEFLERLVGPLIAKPSRSPKFQAALRKVIEARIMERAPETRSTLRRFLRRFNYIRAFSKERADWHASVGPQDLFDVTMLHGAQAPDDQLLEVFSGLVFAILGSVGLTLGWSLMLAVANKMEQEDPRHIVSEALRLYPIAWMLARTPAVEHDVLGEHVTPQDAVVVSPYAIGRNPRLWDAPNAFRPRRWADNPDRSAWLPFGAGPHMCIAIGLSIDLVSAILAEIFARYDAAIVMGDPKPTIGASLAPPRYTLTLRAKSG